MLIPRCPRCPSLWFVSQMYPPSPSAGPSYFLSTTKVAVLTLLIPTVLLLLLLLLRTDLILTPLVTKDPVLTDLAVLTTHAAVLVMAQLRLLGTPAVVMSRESKWAVATRIFLVLVSL